MNANEPAFPSVQPEELSVDKCNWGLTKREKFVESFVAAFIQNGNYIASCNYEEAQRVQTRRMVIDNAIAMADEVLARLAKEPK